MAVEALAVAQTGEDQPHSLLDHVYRALRQAIITSEFAPGMQVSAQELAARFGVSRTPIQEACLRLQEEGLVRILPKRGILICALSPDDMREIFGVIIAIEGDAAALCAAMAEDERHVIADALHAATDAIETALQRGDTERRGIADAEFHQTLVERCGNQRFSRIIATVNGQSHRARMLTAGMRSDLFQSVVEHRHIADTIRAGDQSGALSAARGHRMRARDEILPLMTRFGLKHL